MKYNHSKILEHLITSTILGNFVTVSNKEEDIFLVVHKLCTMNTQNRFPNQCKNLSYETSFRYTLNQYNIFMKHNILCVAFILCNVSFIV
jgi:hypothetical protein